MQKKDLNTLVNILEKMAKKEADGHITIMKFTNDWKAAFATPQSRYWSRKEANN